MCVSQRSSVCPTTPVCFKNCMWYPGINSVQTWCVKSASAILFSVKRQCYLTECCLLDSSAMIFVTVSVMFRIITQFYQTIMFYFVFFVCPNWLFIIVLAFVPAPPLPPPCVCVCVCCLLYTSPSPRDRPRSRMPSSA